MSYSIFPGVEFTLHSKLTKKIFVTDLPLCRVLLEDESHYPWLILVPRRLRVSKIMDLDPLDQLQLMQELDFLEGVINSFDFDYMSDTKQEELINKNK